MTGILALVLAAAAEQEPVRIHGGLSFGVGTAYSIAGIHGELGFEHVGIYAGIGVNATSGTDSSGGAGLSFGARWYSQDRRGWFLSLNFMYAWSEWLTNPDVISQGTSAPMNTASLFTAGSTIGYRFSFGPAFIDLGAGALWYRNRDHVYCVPNCFEPYPDRGPLKHGVFPDGVFGFGFDL